MKLTTLFLTTLTATALAACSGKSGGIQRTEADAARKAKADPADSTLYVKLTSVRGDSLVATDQHSDAEVVLSVIEANQSGRVFGNLISDDTYALTTVAGKHTVQTAINLSQLEGMWLLADKSGNGIRLEADGAASIVGSLADITLRSWRIFNGQLMLSFIKNDGSNYEETEEAVRLVKLSTDALSMSFHNHHFDFYREK